MITEDWPTLDVLRLRYISRVLERSGGNKTRAADMLGIDRRTLNRILARERAKAAAAARNYRAVQGGGQPQGPGHGGGHPQSPGQGGGHPQANGAAAPKANGVTVVGPQGHPV
jgi:hypothetical protein